MFIPSSPVKDLYRPTASTQYSDLGPYSPYRGSVAPYPQLATVGSPIMPYQQPSAYYNPSPYQYNGIPQHSPSIQPALAYSQPILPDYQQQYSPQHYHDGLVDVPAQQLVTNIAAIPVDYSILPIGTRRLDGTTPPISSVIQAIPQHQAFSGFIPIQTQPIQPEIYTDIPAQQVVTNIQTIPVSYEIVPLGTKKISG